MLPPVIVACASCERSCRARWRSSTTSRVPSRSGSRSRPQPSCSSWAVAERYSFTPTDVSGPAGKPFTLLFENKDPDTLHDIDILSLDSPKANLRWADRPRPQGRDVQRAGTAAGHIQIRMLCSSGE